MIACGAAAIARCEASAIAACRAPVIAIGAPAVASCGAPAIAAQRVAPDLGEKEIEPLVAPSCLLALATRYIACAARPARTGKALPQSTPDPAEAAAAATKRGRVGEALQHARAALAHNAASLENLLSQRQAKFLVFVYEPLRGLDEVSEEHEPALAEGLQAAKHPARLRVLALAGVASDKHLWLCAVCLFGEERVP